MATRTKVDNTRRQFVFLLQSKALPLPAGGDALVPRTAVGNELANYDRQ